MSHTTNIRALGGELALLISIVYAYSSKKQSAICLSISVAKLGALRAAQY